MYLLKPTLNNLIIKSGTLKDAAHYWHLRLQLHNETEFILLSPEEKQIALHKPAYLPEEIINDKALFLLAWHEEKPVGFLMAQYEAISQSVHKVTLGVLQEYTGFGIGSSLLSKLEAWSRMQDAKSVCINVMTHNHVAFGMYKRRGYKIFGKSKFQLYGSDRNVEDYFLRLEFPSRQ